MFSMGRRRASLPLRTQPALPSTSPRPNSYNSSVDLFKGTNSNYVESIALDTAQPKAFPNPVWLSPSTSEKFNVTRSHRFIFVLQHLSLRRIFELFKLILSRFSFFLGVSLSLHLEIYFSFIFLPFFLAIHPKGTTVPFR